MRKIVCILLLSALSAFATTVFIDFGAGTGVTSPAWPSTSAAIVTNTGVLLTAGSLTLDVGELTMSGNGSLFCVVGTTANTCATVSSVDTTGKSAGLGVGDGRVSNSDTLTLTLNNAAYTVTLVSFSLTNFGTAAAAETAQYRIDGGSQNVVTSPGVDVPLDTYTVNQQFLNTVVFSVPAAGGTWALATLNLDVTPVPEPATICLLGFGLAGLGFAARRRNTSRRAWLRAE
jgi:PEP-CTERM motif